MTYRELLKLYKQGENWKTAQKKTDRSGKSKKQDAISEISFMKKEQYQISLIWRVGRTISMI